MQNYALPTDTKLYESIQQEAAPVLIQLSNEDLSEIRGALDLLCGELHATSRENRSMRERWIRANALWTACDKILSQEA